MGTTPSKEDPVTQTYLWQRPMIQAEAVETAGVVARFAAAGWTLAATTRHAAGFVLSYTFTKEA